MPDANKAEMILNGIYVVVKRDTRCDCQVGEQWQFVGSTHAGATYGVFRRNGLITMTDHDKVRRLGQDEVANIDCFGNSIDEQMAEIHKHNSPCPPDDEEPDEENDAYGDPQAVAVLEPVPLQDILPEICNKLEDGCEISIRLTRTGRSMHYPANFGSRADAG